MKWISAVVVSTSIAATAGMAQAGLESEEDINDGLLVIAAADKIRRACDGIGARIFKARSYATGLTEVAKKRGYSDAEVDAYINDKQNKAAMRERRNAYFQSKGASNLDAQSLCVLGKTEIAAGTQIGQLLRAK